MRLTVFSHKRCWSSSHSPSGYATDGGFPFQMRTLSELFDETRLVVPCDSLGSHEGEIPLTGHHLSVVPLTPPRGQGLRRKAGLLCWLLRNGTVLIREVFRAEAVHTPIPGDIGTLAMLPAWIFHKPLFVRYCGNWFVQKTLAQRFWKCFMERFAGGKNIMLATGGGDNFPSLYNPAVRWIFASSLTEKELDECAAPGRKTSGTSPRLIIACRQEEAKGTSVVIESLPLILKDFPEATLDVVGEGNKLLAFKRQVETLGLQRHVVFHGRVTHEEVLERLHKADLFCYPTASAEGFPKVVLEALACGLPVITTRVSVLPQLMSNGCGVLLEERTPEALAEATYSCLSDEGRYRTMSTRAIRTAHQYSLEKWRDTIGAILEEAWGPLRGHDAA